MATYNIRAYGSPVTPSSPGVRHATVDALLKENTPASPFLVANEAIATGLAQSLGLPVPAGGVVPTEGGGVGWVSLHFGPGGERPPPVIPEDVLADHRAIAAGIVAFDSWIANADRHPSNIAYIPGVAPVTAFDHGHALLGADTQGLARLTSQQDRPSDTGCLHDGLTNAADLHDWATEIATVPRRRLDAICRHARDAGALPSDLIDPIVDFLDHRKTRIMEYLKASADLFPNITQWSLT